MSILVPVIICGGSGSRLWPLSRDECAKPFVTLPGRAQSLLSDTYARIQHSAAAPPAAIITVAAAADLSLCRAHNIISDIKQFYIGEPVARNTAAAIISAAVAIASRYGEDAVMLVLPADHHIGDIKSFQQAQTRAIQAAQKGGFVLLGITPDYAATGYGYIERGDAVATNVFKVRRFVEKPDLPTAQQFINNGNFLWNAGIFCMTARALLAALPTYAADFCAPLSAITKTLPAAEDDTWLPPQESYNKFPNISFDYALMEKIPNAAVVAADNLQWSDVGSWQAIANTLPADKNGNRVNNDNNKNINNTLYEECHNCMFIGQQRLIAAIGLNDIHVIDTPDATLIVHADSSEKVRNLYNQLKTQSRAEATTPVTVKKPWGSYTVLSEAAGYKIKSITVLPNAKLSLQSHKHRSEHWTTVAGVMQIIIDEREFTQPGGQSCFIPQGAKHRMINTTDKIAIIIEVQIGDYLGEDDITRYEDNYGRV